MTKKSVLALAIIIATLVHTTPSIAKINDGVFEAAQLAPTGKTGGKGIGGTGSPALDHESSPTDDDLDYNSDETLFDTPSFPDAIIDQGTPYVPDAGPAGQPDLTDPSTQDTETGNLVAP